MNLAKVCERYGGGGHARVGAISFDVNQQAEARKAAEEIVEELGRASGTSGTVAMSSKLIPPALHSAEHRARLQALRTVALLEFAKGVVVLAAVFSLYWLDPSDVAGAFLNFLHISPDHHFARLFMQMADKLSNIKLWHLIVGSLRSTPAYALLRPPVYGGRVHGRSGSP